MQLIVATQLPGVPVLAEHLNRGGEWSENQEVKHLATAHAPPTEQLELEYLRQLEMVERNADGLFNTTDLIGPDGEIAACYRKIHLFGYQSDETKLLTPGREIVVADTPWGRAGFSTCYDLRFPELFRRMVDRGAELFLVPSAWPLARIEAWRLFNSYESASGREPQAPAG